MNLCLRVRADPSALATWNLCIFMDMLLLFNSTKSGMNVFLIPRTRFPGIVGQTTNGRIYLFVHRVGLKILHGFVVSCWSGRYSKELVVVSSKKEKYTRY